MRSNKIKYYDDRLFKKRLLSPTPIPVQEPYDPRKHQKSKDNESNDNDNEDTEEEKEDQA
jgi:type IV secretory pathway TraG/TraD family ATPase VirD4